MNGLWGLLRDARRRALRTPGFTLLTVVLLAIGSGAALLLASLYDQVALARLPVPRPDELRLIEKTNISARGDVQPVGRLSRQECEELRRGAQQQLELACFVAGESIVGFAAATQRTAIEVVTPDYFTVLRLAPAAGRLLSAKEDAGGAPAVVLSYAAWQRHFGGSAAVLGHSLAVDGRRAVVVGVAPARYRSLLVGSAPELFELAAAARREDGFRAVARLRPGARALEAQARLRGIYAEVLARTPRQSFMIIDGQVLPARERIDLTAGARGVELRGTLGSTLLLALSMIAAVLLILCVNLANLLAARAADERRQVAVRRALGATAWQLGGAWLTESLALTSTGVALGLLVAEIWGPPVLRSLPELGLGPAMTFAVNQRVALLAFLLCLATSAVVGGLAAWEARRVPLGVLLASGGTASSASRTGTLLRWGLVSLQVGVSIVLLVIMGLLGHSLRSLLALDTGLPLDRILAVRLDLPAEGRHPPGALQALQEELAALPAVRQVAYSTVPLLSRAQAFSSVSVEGFAPPAGEAQMVNTIGVSPGFFEALDIPAKRGRTYQRADTAQPARAVVVNQRFVDRYLPAVDPIGRHLALALERKDWSHSEPGDLEIVGVVADHALSDVREAAVPRLYPLARPTERSVVFYLQTSVPAATLGNSLRRVLRSRAPEAALGETLTLRRQRDLLLGHERLLGGLAQGIALAGSLIAALGLYGVTRLAIAARRREIALRVALGARPRQVARFVTRDAARAVGVGVLAGCAAAAPAARLLQSQLYGVGPDDPRAYATALAALLVIATLACWPPVLRALRADPATVLKE
jgi:putative ABC transport system permease protein